MHTSHTAKQRLLAQARLDYQPALVAIDQEAITRLPARGDRFSHLTVGLVGKPAGQTPEGAAAYGIALNSMNFMFWTPTPDGMARYHWRGEGGAQGLQAALDHLWGDNATPRELRACLGSGEEQAVVDALGDISMPRRRAQFLREILFGDQLEQAASELVDAAKSGRLTSDDAQRLAQRFPMSYGQDPYLVRAQLAVMWFAGYLFEQGVDVDCDITVAASYQMPRVMRSIKVLRFAPELAAKIDSHALILRQSDEERAIRSATVLGAQAMAQHLGVSEHAMVNVLWQNRHACGAIPYHLTITTDY
ncbi:MAG TPA: queuosine salvage family protein [Noviherbaspirillum sp.]|uniref:queuosine salvage family protein n=1 Tax=Noviherbaspirillum sp. TaxID=1926288 RepID=UPI002B4A4E49|nr:queuosine salvage family protein [Noviherbaspirillum sp.]HJV86474.1 queuosine salvage family protein [Noviherbaspirillum sp.]